MMWEAKAEPGREDDLLAFVLAEAPPTPTSSAAATCASSSSTAPAAACPSRPPDCSPDPRTLALRPGATSALTAVCGSCSDRLASARSGPRVLHVSATPETSIPDRPSSRSGLPAIPTDPAKLLRRVVRTAQNAAEVVRFGGLETDDETSPFTVEAEQRNLPPAALLRRRRPARRRRSCWCRR